jgi:hypothetical protein
MHSTEHTSAAVILRIFPLFLLLFALTATSGQAAWKLTLKVRDFGAVGDGKTKDTASYNKHLTSAPCSAAARCWSRRATT